MKELHFQIIRLQSFSLSVNLILDNNHAKHALPKDAKAETGEANSDMEAKNDLKYKMMTTFL